MMPRQDERQVRLVRDVDTLFDEHGLDRAPADGHAQDLGGGGCDFVEGPAHADPTGLAAAAGAHLRLDRDRKTKLARRFGGGVGRPGRLAGRDRQPRCREQRLALVFEEVHARPALPEARQRSSSHGAQGAGASPAGACPPVPARVRSS